MARASRSTLQGRTNDVTGTGHNRHPVNNISDPHTTKADEKTHGMALTRKVMLCGQLVGTEMIVNFAQIYTVPLLFSTMMLVTGLTSRLETVFALSVVAGMIRTSFCTMTYAVTNDIAKTIACTSTSRSPVSLVMSLVAATIPLAYCVLFSWAGALEELTGNPSAPLWLGTVYGVLGMTAFLFVGKVE